MKSLLTILLISFFLKSYSQIDSIVHHISDSTASSQIAALNLISVSTILRMTTDGTTVNVDSLVIPVNRIALYEIKIATLNHNSNLDAGSYYTILVIKNNNGIYQIVRGNALMGYSGQTSVSGCKISFITGTNCAIIQITGIKNTSIRWTVNVEQSFIL